MLRICPLFSSSSGNSLVIIYKEEAILIDAGVSASRIEKMMKLNDINPQLIKNIFVTHEHGDHIKGLDVFARRYKCNVYASNGTVQHIKNKNLIRSCVNLRVIKEIGLFFKNIFVKPFPISHDCSEGYGFSIEISKFKISVCSDLGFCSNKVLESLKKSDIVFIESNHDIGMLKNGSYPYSVKRRILSNVGHLSNKACSQILPILANSGTKHFVLSHLSSQNNTEKIAYDSALHALERYGMRSDFDFKLNVAPKENSKKFNINLS